MTKLKQKIRELSEGDIVAFKSKEFNEWYTGGVTFIALPEEDWNKDHSYSISISTILRVQPQWLDDDDQTIFYLEEITELVLLEKN